MSFVLFFFIIFDKVIRFFIINMIYFFVFLCQFLIKQEKTIKFKFEIQGNVEIICMFFPLFGGKKNIF